MRSGSLKALIRFLENKMISKIEAVKSYLVMTKRCSFYYKRLLIGA